jgi:hypothetical protein
VAPVIASLAIMTAVLTKAIVFTAKSEKLFVADVGNEA